MNKSDVKSITNNGFGQLPAEQFNEEYLRLIKVDLANARAHRHEMPAEAKRGLIDETINHFGLGYLPDWINTKSRAEFACGIYVKKDTGEVKHLPPPSRRIIIPTDDGEHFNAVVLPADRQHIHKDFWKQHAGEKRIFGDKDTVANADIVIVVEGEFDAMSIWQATDRKIAVVAILGCSNWKKTLLPNLSTLLKGKKIILLLDGDKDGREQSDKLRAELTRLAVPAVSRYLYDAMNFTEGKAKFNNKVDANEILEQCGGEFLKNLIERIIDGAREELTKAEKSIRQQNLFQMTRPENQSSDGNKPKSATAPVVTNEIVELARAALKAIPVAQCSEPLWTKIIWAGRASGLTLEELDEWSRNDSRYNPAKVASNFNRYDPKKTGVGGKPLTVASLVEIAKDFGFTPATAQSENYESIFDGIKPIRACAGSILNVAAAEDKTALEELFCYRNFHGFVDAVTVEHNDGSENEFSNTPYGDGGFMLSDVRFALKWLIVKVYRYFKTCDEAKNFIGERLLLAEASGAMKIVDDEQFWKSATETAENLYHGKTYDFTEKYRRELIDFAKKHPRFLYSLRRFDYRRLSRFLQQSSFTNVVCAELLIDIQGDFLRFDEQQGTWYSWTGNFWQAIKIKSIAPLYSAWTPLARKIRVFAEIERLRKFCERDDFEINNPECTQKIPKTATEKTAVEKYKRLQVAAKTAAAKSAEADELENSRAIGNYFEQASGLPEIKIKTSDLDRDKYRFNAANVTLDLQTMETYKARQSDLITMSTDTVFDPDAVSEDWTNFLEAAIPDENLRDWLQRFFGYALSGDTSEHIFVFIHGVGGSGKTTFLNAIGGALGDYAQIFSVDAICENKKQKDGDEASPALAALRACRLARSSETKKNRRLDEATVKRWTGSDPLPARELYKPQFKFKPSFKIVIDGNFALRVTDINDDGLRRRLRIAPFDNPPAPDKIDTKLSDKLSTPQAKSAILNWLLEGWRKYQTRGLSDKPAVMQTALDNFYTANDTLRDFLEAHDYQAGNKTNIKNRVPVLAAWQAYQRWQRQTPTASMLTRADFVDAFIRATQKDGVELQTIMHKQFFVGCRMDENTDANFIPPPEN